MINENIEFENKSPSVEPLAFKRASRRGQFVVLAALLILLLPIVFSLWAIPKIESATLAKNRLLQKREALEGISSGIKRRALLNLEIDDEGAKIFDHEIALMFNDLENRVAADPNELKNLKEIRRRWEEIIHLGRAYPPREILGLDRDLENERLQQNLRIESRTPEVFRWIDLLMFFMTTIAVIAFGIVGYVLLSMKKENLNNELMLEDLKRSREAALESSKLKSKFLATVSHEIRTPLNGIIGIADLMRRSNLSEENKSYTQLIFNSGKTLLKVINDILDFSKIESGHLVLENSEFNWVNLIQQIKETLRPTADKKNIKLISQFDTQLPAKVYGDPDRLAQVLFNLIGNAIKFTSEGEVSIIVSLIEAQKKRERVNLRFEVQDTGMGLSEDQLTHLFVPFMQFSKVGTSGEAGTGLGLSISQYLVNAMGGEIKVESLHGKGSKFYFELDLRCTDFTEIGSIEHNSLTKAPSRFNLENQVSNSESTVLIVEDNPTNQIIAQSMLKVLGINSIITSNGKEALDVLSERQVDLILMDCQMPIMDGYEATKEIRKRKMTVPVLAMTANASKDDEQRCRGSGMNGVLIKPFTIDDLAREIESLAKNTTLELNYATLDLLAEKIGQEALIKVVNTFVSTLSEFRAQLSSSLESKDFDSLNRIGHRFKSSALSVGAEQFGNFCRDLENASSLEEIPKMRDALLKGSLDLEVQFKKYLTKFE